MNFERIMSHCEAVRLSCGRTLAVVCIYIALAVATATNAEAGNAKSEPEPETTSLAAVVGEAVWYRPYIDEATLKKFLGAVEQRSQIEWLPWQKEFAAAVPFIRRLQTEGPWEVIKPRPDEGLMSQVIGDLVAVNIGAQRTVTRGRSIFAWSLALGWYELEQKKGAPYHERSVRGILQGIRAADEKSWERSAGARVHDFRFKFEPHVEALWIILNLVFESNNLGLDGDAHWILLDFAFAGGPMWRWLGDGEFVAMRTQEGLVDAAYQDNAMRDLAVSFGRQLQETVERNTDLADIYYQLAINALADDILLTAAVDTEWVRAYERDRFRTYPLFKNEGELLAILARCEARAGRIHQATNIDPLLKGPVVVSVGIDRLSDEPSRTFLDAEALINAKAYRTWRSTFRPFVGQINEDEYSGATDLVAGLYGCRRNDEGQARQGIKVAWPKESRLLCYCLKRHPGMWVVIKGGEGVGDVSIGVANRTWQYEGVSLSKFLIQIPANLVCCRGEEGNLISIEIAGEEGLSVSVRQVGPQTCSGDGLISSD